MLDDFKGNGSQPALYRRINPRNFEAVLTPRSQTLLPGAPVKYSTPFTIMEDDPSGPRAVMHCDVATND